ncbi:MAG: hypothetical protein L3J41_17010 [Melioribacteraceae bacterium]|nr:hypothetical protein [Melioribacteraceae bacterium]
MNIIIPQNIFSALFALSLPNKYKDKVIIKESSLISQDLEKDKKNIALIPSLDLLKHQELFVSKKIGISFGGILSNSYFYFIPEQTTFNKILLKGDLSSNDIILSKILFPELFGVEPEFAIDVNPIDFQNNNYLIVGVDNESYPITKNGISFTEQIDGMIDLPYVNFVLASYEKDSLLEVENELLGLDEKIEKQIDELFGKLKLDSDLRNYLLDNFQSVYYDFTEIEVEGLTELLKLPYYHGIVEDLVDIKFV